MTTMPTPLRVQPLRGVQSSLRFLVAAVLLSFSLASAVQAKTTQTFTFTNNAGEDANDLHVETKQAAEPVAGTDGKFGAFDNSKAESGNKHVFSGGDVLKEKSTKIKFESTSSKITILKWWWSKDGHRIGRVNEGTSR